MYCKNRDFFFNFFLTLYCKDNILSNPYNFLKRAIFGTNHRYIERDPLVHFVKLLDILYTHVVKFLVCADVLGQ